MPYVLVKEAKAIAEGGPFLRAGELNCAITSLCLKFLDDQGGISYGRLNDVVGALECAKAEFIRRVVTPYEKDKAIQAHRVDPYAVFNVRQKEQNELDDLLSELSELNEWDLYQA